MINTPKAHIPVRKFRLAFWILSEVLSEKSLLEILFEPFFNDERNKIWYDFAIKQFQSNAEETYKKKPYKWDEIRCRTLFEKKKKKKRKLSKNFMQRMTYRRKIIECKIQCEIIDKPIGITNRDHSIWYGAKAYLLVILPLLPLPVSVATICCFPLHRHCTVSRPINLDCERCQRPYINKQFRWREEFILLLLITVICHRILYLVCVCVFFPSSLSLKKKICFVWKQIRCRPSVWLYQCSAKKKMWQLFTSVKLDSNEP